MENTKENRTYARILILEDELQYLHKWLQDDGEWQIKLITLKHSFTTLMILKQSFQHFNFLLSKDPELTQLAKTLKARLEFINHIRNRISGHLDEIVLDKAIQWEPMIFFDLNRNNEGLKTLLLNKSLIESAINSYLDKDANQKVFNTEIDLIYPPDNKLFFQFIDKLTIDSIDLLKKLKSMVEIKVKYWSNENLVETMKKAGKTDFDLKKKTKHNKG